MYRDMPWRQDTRPYYILVSELMLQQTQVDRVIPKFTSFIAQFPDEETLAKASLADILRAWQGLGYNRRAKFLHEAARHIVAVGKFPDNESDLILLPGIGKNTAGAILAYAFNKQALFIETNVRAVYIHHFFVDSNQVDDKEIHKLLEQTIDREHPRDFYWALMDYGSWLKKQGIGPNRSSHYKKQSPLRGSVREVRGQILRELTDTKMTVTRLKKEVDADDRFDRALAGLIADGLVSQKGDKLHLTK